MFSRVKTTERITMDFNKDLYFQNGLTDVQLFYSSTTILITGGTGFIGKLLIEKLLRSCKHLRKIYLIVRPKKGNTPEQRLKDLLDHKVFSEVHIYNENFKNQIHVIEGNLEEHGLGLKESDRQLLIDEVELVFHLGAAIRFDQPLNKIAYVNVQATREMIKLAHQMKNLKMFTYVSTAYAHCYKDTNEEIIHDVPMTPSELIDLVENTPEEELLKNTLEILGKWPNTYMFTKAIAEHVILHEGKGLPRIITRPSMVTSTYAEPFPGWFQNIYGPGGLVLFTGMGLLHVFYANPKAFVDYIPADYVINHIICATYDGYKNKKEIVEEVPVYACSTSFQNPITIGDQFFWLDTIESIAPVINGVFRPWYFTIKNLTLFLFFHQLIHAIPAHLFDFILKKINRKPVAKRSYKTFKELSLLLKECAVKTKIFFNVNTQAMNERLSLKDRKLFSFDVANLCWHTYGYTTVIGGKKHVLKEPAFDLKDFQAALKKRKLQTILHYSIIFLFFYAMYCLLSLFI